MLLQMVLSMFFSLFHFPSSILRKFLKSQKHWVDIYKLACLLLKESKSTISSQFKEAFIIEWSLIEFLKANSLLNDNFLTLIEGIFRGKDLKDDELKDNERKKKNQKTSDNVIQILKCLESHQMLKFMNHVHFWIGINIEDTFTIIKVMEENKILNEKNLDILITKEFLKKEMVSLMTGLVKVKVFTEEIFQKIVASSCKLKEINDAFQFLSKEKFEENIFRFFLWQVDAIKFGFVLKAAESLKENNILTIENLVVFNQTEGKYINYAQEILIQMKNFGLLNQSNFEYLLQENIICWAKDLWNVFLFLQYDSHDLMCNINNFKLICENGFVSKHLEGLFKQLTKGTKVTQKDFDEIFKKKQFIVQLSSFKPDPDNFIFLMKNIEKIGSAKEIVLEMMQILPNFFMNEEILEILLKNQMKYKSEWLEVLKDIFFYVEKPIKGGEKLFYDLECTQAFCNQIKDKYRDEEIKIPVYNHCNCYRSDDCDGSSHFTGYRTEIKKVRKFFTKEEKEKFVETYLTKI